jgi:hypothetical protein
MHHFHAAQDKHFNAAPAAQAPAPIPKQAKISKRTKVNVMVEVFFF